jgi:hypothetical protein
LMSQDSIDACDNGDRDTSKTSDPIVHFSNICRVWRREWIPVGSLSLRSSSEEDGLVTLRHKNFTKRHATKRAPIGNTESELISRVSGPYRGSDSWLRGVSRVPHISRTQVRKAKKPKLTSRLLQDHEGFIGAC